MNSQCGLIRLHNKGVNYAIFSCRIALPLRLKSTTYQGVGIRMDYVIESNQWATLLRDNGFV